jgi:hypothetical protein
MINEVNNINEMGFKANLVAALQLTQFHSVKTRRDRKHKRKRKRTNQPPNSQRQT